MSTLIIGIVVLSIADLAVTLTHLRTIGMMEANPIAAWLIETTRSSWALAAYKFLTVGICVGLLFKLRRHFEGELAAWASLLILAGMSVTWHVYAKEFEHPETIQLVQAGAYGEKWLILD